jgi:hypothetical protein
LIQVPVKNAPKIPNSKSDMKIGRMGKVRLIHPSFPRSSRAIHQLLYSMMMMMMMAR